MSRTHRLRATMVGLVLTLGLAACTGGAPEPAPVSPVARADARLVDAPAPEIEVTVKPRRSDQQVTEAALVAPDGTRTPATRYDRSAALPDDSGRPRVGVVVGSDTRVGISVPILRSGAPQDGDLVVARIPVPDPDAYRATRDGWRIAITVTDGRGERDETVISAP